jgi:DnaJ-class molecular chaperone
MTARNRTDGRELPAVDLSETWVREWCRDCGGSGVDVVSEPNAKDMVGINGPGATTSTRVALTLCPTCNGTGRQVRWAYAEGTGEQEGQPR